MERVYRCRQQEAVSCPRAVKYPTNIVQGDTLKERSGEAGSGLQGCRLVLKLMCYVSSDGDAGGTVEDSTGTENHLGKC